MAASQTPAQPLDGRQQASRGQSHGPTAAPVSERRDTRLPPDAAAINIQPHRSWTTDPTTLESAAHDLPPRYDLHQFPPTPPTLHGSELGSGSYFDQAHHAPADHTPPIGADWSPSEQPPRLFASRFPRWGSWLEKRALERHYAHLESQQSRNQHLAPSHGAETPNRKKSWGAWVNDPDAVDDGIPSSSASPAPPERNTSSLPSLHVEHFGSRFIPHLSAQPLCSILVEIPPATSRSHHDNGHARQVLLVGTVQGLFAVQFRAYRASFPGTPSASSPSSQSEPSHQWNDNVRCIPIWTGLAVYQMCVLASQNQANLKSAHTSHTERTAGSGVLLALTSPSSAKDGFLASSLMQLSAHAGSVLESVAASAAFPSSSSSSSHSSHGVSDSPEGIAAANFGSTSGGGPGRAVPPGGTGLVRMWHLQAIRDLLVYALDNHDAQIPINLAATPGSQAEKRTGFGSMFKKTFSRQKGRSEVKAGGHERSASSAFLSTTVQPLRPPGALSPSQSQPSLPSSSGSQTRAGDFERASRPEPARNPSRDRGHNSTSPQTSPPAAKRQVDPAHAAAIRLALSSVPIQPPSHATASSHSNNASFTSLFADDLIQSFSGSRHAGGKGKDREIGAQAASKGVLFFSVHEADKDTKASGTWYLAIAYARSVLIYEAAAIPRNGAARAWSFLKELYAPFPIKAVAFAPAAVSDELHPFTSMGPLAPSTGPTKLRVASAEGTLTSKKGSTREAPRVSGGSSPINTPRGSAAPASWHKADLCLLLSFGRRAVLVRLRDSHVREMEVKPLAQLLAADASTTQLSLQTPSLRGTTGAQPNHDHSRPLSLAGDGELSGERQLPHATAHLRTGSMEQRLRDVIFDKRSSKHNWVGFSTVEARIYVRQWSEPAEERRQALNDTWRYGLERSGPSPLGLSMAKGSGAATPLSPAGVDKDLPRVPAPQNASFDRRISTLHLSEQSSQYHGQLQAESSSDSDDDFGIVDTRERAAKYQLMDPGPLLQQSGRRARTNVGTKTPNRSLSLPPAELVSTKLALASRGALTHVLSLPLATDLAQAAPLAVMQWSDTPNAVSGWARVLGIERATSRGTTSLSHLRPPQTTRSCDSQGPLGEFRTHHETMGQSTFDAPRKVDTLVLHVGVTCVAFLASRIESKKVSFKVPVQINFDLLPDSELELLSLSPDTGYARVNGGAAGMSPTNSSGDANDDATNSEDGERADKQDSEPFAYPAVHSAGLQAASNRNEPSAISQELEYLCAPLLTLHPVDLDVHSCGAQSLVLPLSQASGHESTAHAMLANHAGDAGVVAFDWRGADDFRIFTVGIAG